ncbi:3835_t:CDS:1, partial [Dentiscutata heterogama]
DKIHAIEASGHIVTNIAVEKKALTLSLKVCPSSERATISIVGYKPWVPNVEFTGRGL